MNMQAVEKTDLPGEATSAPAPAAPLVATLPEEKKAAAPAKRQVRARASAPRKAAPAAKTAPTPQKVASVKAKVATSPAKPSAKTPAKVAAKPVRKVTAAVQPAPKAEVAKNDKAAKPKKAKLVRDSFTMPQSEYDLIASIKKRCMTNGFSVKKSEVLRAAVIRFSALNDKQLTAALTALDVIKTGRPPKGQK